LEKSYEACDLDFNLLKVDPFVDSLWDDPRFKDPTKRMNMAE
jgi:hypothetical protein